MMRVAAGGQVVTLPGVYEVRRPLGRMGTPYGQYLLDDVTAGKVPAKMYVLLSPGACRRPSASSCSRRPAAHCGSGATRRATKSPRIAGRDARTDRLQYEDAGKACGAGRSRPTPAGKWGLRKALAAMRR